MGVVRSFHSKLVGGLIAAALMLVSRSAAAQYTAKVLLPPADLPQNTPTTGFAMNNSGQVVGEVRASNADRRPVLWTNGVPVYLTLPAGYAWASDFTQTFLNDHGTVVASVFIPGGLAGGRLNAPRIAIWHSPDAPQILQLDSLPTVCAADFHYPAGLNNSGHVLFQTADLTPCDAILWRWNGSGTASTDFTQLVVLYGGRLPCSLEYSIRLGRSNLNDLDHVALDYRPRNGPDPFCASVPDFTPVLASGILAGGTFTPRITSQVAGGAQGVNNSDQFIAVYADQGVKFWDGTSSVDFGVIGATPPNDLGQVLLWTHAGEVKIFQNGAASNVSIPQQVPGFPSILPSGFGATGFNVAGQILTGFFFQYNGPLNLPTQQAVLLTPPRPIITWTPPADIVYGTALGAAQLNATANMAGTFVFAPVAGTVLGAGARTLSVTFTPTDPAFTTATASVPINVLPAPLTVTAANAGKLFGAPLPPFGAGYAGFVNGDSPASLTGTLTLTTAATPASPVGQYAIVPSGLSSANYAIDFVAGTLTIAQASTTLGLTSGTPVSVVGQSVTLTATVGAVAPGAGVPTGAVTLFDGAAALGTVSLSNGVASLTTSALSVGSHTIAAQYGGDANFLGSANTTTQTVAAGVFSIAASAKFVKSNSGQWVATITLKNVGTAWAVGAQMGALLNNVGMLDSAPLLPDFGPGQSVLVFLSFPGSAGVSGSVNNALRIQVSSRNGNATISQRVALP